MDVDESGGIGGTLGRGCGRRNVPLAHGGAALDRTQAGADTEAMPRPRKPPRAITAEYLDRAALHYLERYASSA